MFECDLKCSVVWFSCTCQKVCKIYAWHGIGGLFNSHISRSALKYPYLLCTNPQINPEYCSVMFEVIIAIAAAALGSLRMHKCVTAGSL